MTRRYIEVSARHHDQTLPTVVPAMDGHPWDQAKVSVHDRWPLIRGRAWVGLRHQTHYNSIMQPTRDIHSEYMH